MNLNLEHHDDDLRRLWQQQPLPNPESNQVEARKLMAQVEARAKKFERTIFWRNVREYVAGGIGAAIFAMMAAKSQTRLEFAGNAIVSASALWIVLYMWLRQRWLRKPLPESDGEFYRHSLLAQYDRQISLLRTAWAWYALPITAGLVISVLGNNHSPLTPTLIMAGVMVAAGVFIAIINWAAAGKLSEERRDLERMLSVPSPAR